MCKVLDQRYTQGFSKYVSANSSDGMECVWIVHASLPRSRWTRPPSHAADGGAGSLASSVAAGVWRGEQKQNPRNSRRNALPAARIDGPLLMRHAHLTCPFRELMQITHTPSRSESVLHRPPEAFEGMEVVTTVGREAMEAHRAVVVVEGRVELVRPRDPAP